MYACHLLRRSLTNVSIAVKWQHHCINRLLFEVRIAFCGNLYIKEILIKLSNVFLIKSQDIKAGGIRFKTSSWACCEMEAASLFKAHSVLKLAAKILDAGRMYQT